MVNKTSSSRDSICDPPETSTETKDKPKLLEEIGKKESKEERKEKVESLPRMGSVEQGQWRTGLPVMIFKLKQHLQMLNE